MDVKKLRKAVEKHVEDIDALGLGGTMRCETILALMETVITSFESDSLLPVKSFDPECIINDGVEEDS